MKLGLVAAFANTNNKELTHTASMLKAQFSAKEPTEAHVTLMSSA